MRVPAEEVLEGGTAHRGDVFFVGKELAVGVWEADASTLAVSEPVCSQNSSATSDELIAAVEAVGQAASRQTYRW
jgi:hypothetical protein